MYSAFSERSPSAAAAANAFTTSRRRSHMPSSSFCRAVKPADVIYAEDGGAGGRQRPMTSKPRGEAATLVNSTLGIEFGRNISTADHMRGNAGGV